MKLFDKKGSLKDFIGKSRKNLFEMKNSEISRLLESKTHFSIKEISQFGTLQTRRKKDFNKRKNKSPLNSIERE